jgi:hypothetical protein
VALVFGTVAGGLLVRFASLGLRAALSTALLSQDFRDQLIAAPLKRGIALGKHRDEDQVPPKRINITANVTRVNHEENFAAHLRVYVPRPQKAAESGAHYLHFLVIRSDRKGDTLSLSAGR